MNRRSIIRLAGFCAVLLIFSLCGCGAGAGDYLTLNNATQDGSMLIGRWLDPDGATEAFLFSDDGSCVFYGDSFDSYAFDGSLLTLTAGEASYSLSSRLFGNDFVIFKKAYSFSRVSGNAGSLEGEWESCDGNSFTFRFRNGSFVEDGSHTGKYFTDKGNADELLLKYDEYDADSGSDYAYCLYSIQEDDTLLVYYGWNLRLEK